jgi:hypothetical protein
MFFSAEFWTLTTSLFGLAIRYILLLLVVVSWLLGSPNLALLSGYVNYSLTTSPNIKWIFKQLLYKTEFYYH